MFWKIPLTIFFPDGQTREQGYQHRRPSSARSSPHPRQRLQTQELHAQRSLLPLFAGHLLFWVKFYCKSQQYPIGRLVKDKLNRRNLLRVISDTTVCSKHFQDLRVWSVQVMIRPERFISLSMDQNVNCLFSSYFFRSKKRMCTTASSLTCKTAILKLVVVWQSIAWKTLTFQSGDTFAFLISIMKSH